MTKATITENTTAPTTTASPNICPMTTTQTNHKYK